MSDIAALVADNIDIWTGAIERKSGAGRGGGKRISLYGIDRLRALILDLAVRGKLVPQDEGDEPASELLKRIKTEKSRLIASGKAKLGKPLVAPVEWPFAIPDRWAWSQLGYVTNYGQTDKADPGSVAPDAWVLELEDVEKGTSRLIERVRCADKPFQSQKNAFQVGDVIYGKLRPYLDKVIIADEAGVCTTEMIPMRGYAGVESDYIRLFLKTPFFISLATNAAHGMNLPRLATEKAREAPFALPPIAEQQRIVVKVNELMALCDALERESAGAMAAHQALVEILLATLVNSADAADLAHDWARLERHFDTLFTTESSIDALKQTILDLAVCGKLSPANDWSKKAEPLGIFARLQNGYAFKSEWFADDGIRLLRNINVSHGSIEWDDAVHLPKSMADIYERFQLSIGDVILTLDRPFIATGTKVATVAAADLPALLLQRVGRFQVGNKIRSDFIFLWVSSPLFSKQVDPGRSNGVPHISSKQVEAAKIFVPPLAEQRRIVAKVDALMALCNALKARLSDAAQTQRKLADVITERAAA